MAQTNFTPISLYYSTTAAAVPTAGNLVAGELAINTTDGRLYYKDTAGVVQTIASKAGALGDVVGPASATDNAISRFDGTTGKIIQNSVVTIADSTGNMAGVGTISSGAITSSSLTSGRVLYAGTSGLIQDDADFTFNGTTVTMANDASISGLTVGKGGGAISTNTAVGSSALAATATGTNNVGVGSSALTALTSGQNNIGVGQAALLGITTGSNNIGVGQGTVAVATTSSDNTAIGHQALNSTSSGASNTAAGSGALRSNTTAAFNTAVGFQAGFSNTTGTANSFFGSQTGYTNTTGLGNAAFGANYSGVVLPTLYFNTTGSSNSAFGIGALANNTTASNNTAVGYQAAYSNTTGVEITAVGYQAGYSNTTGNYSTFVGLGAGKNTTGSNSTFIGNGAGYFVTTGAKNTILGTYGGNQDGLDIRTANNYAVISDGDGNRLLTMANGQTLALDGGAVPNSGTGITFPATQAASSDANTLDDYEEGTWTPSIGGTATYTVQQGNYTKIGRMVNIRCNIVVNLLGTGSTTTISGLPFTSFTTPNANPTASASVGYFDTLAVSPVYISAFVASGGTTMNITGLTAAGNTASAALAVFGNSARIDLTVTYFV